MAGGARARLLRPAAVEASSPQGRAAAAGAPGDDRPLLEGTLPTLDAIELDKSPTLFEKMQMHVGIKITSPEVSFGKNPELLDTLWGQYFATGEYRPVYRILAMLPWAKDRDSVERLTVGSMAKVTLANNATMYPDILLLLKSMAKYQPEDVAKPTRRGHPGGRDGASAAPEEGGVSLDRGDQTQRTGLPARDDGMGLCRPGRDRGRLHRRGGRLADAAAFPAWSAAR